MQKVFEVCFGTGAIFTVISFLLGHILHLGHTDISGTDVDLDFDTNLHGDLCMDSDASVTSLRPAVILAFITTFGGLGIIGLKKGLSDGLSTIIAASIALFVSFLINRFIIIPLNKAQNTSAISQKSIRGNLGKLTIGIIGSGFGKVTYTIGGNTYSAPAKSYDGNDIEKGSEVIIVEIRKKVFYVKKFYYEKITYGLNDD